MIGKQQRLWVCALGAVLLTLAGVGRAFDQNAARASLFSNSSLFGSYVLSFAGYSNPGPGFFAGLGIFSFDGKGNLSGADLQGLGCHVSGSYTVNNDGTGSISLAPACLWSIPGWNFVIANRLGGKVYAFASDSPTVINTVSATFTRRVTLGHSFTAADLSGSYAFLINGTGASTEAVGYGELAGAGILHSDGKGNASATIALHTQLNSFPTICSGTTNGTYTVNPDGTGTLSLTVIWVPPNCVYGLPGLPTLTLTPWSFVFDNARGNRLDLFDNSERVAGKLSRQ